MASPYRPLPFSWLLIGTALYVRQGKTKPMFFAQTNFQYIAGCHDHARQQSLSHTLVLARANFGIAEAYRMDVT
ncbi:MAG: hypothetical protein CFE42_22390 [Ralstonia sp. PBBBR1]|nr:MAG: hypothetical protein CFE42_22390 [Ralstonia sp. PBBBR1]